MKALLARCNIDPSILLLLGTVALASLLPARGIWADIVSLASKIGIVLLFFLHGARLSREAASTCRTCSSSRRLLLLLQRRQPRIRPRAQAAITPA